MGRIGTALRAFFRVLRDRELADQVRRLLDGERVTALEHQAQPAPVEQPPAARAAAQPIKQASKRSEALDLLSAMQREARFIDFVKESLGDYSDAQIGAAVRDIHRDCAKLLDRVFALEPLASGDEGSPIELPPGYEAAHYRLTGNVSGQPPLRGRVVHRGWQAQRCEIPAWTGSEAAARIVAPAEVEIT
jgi:hypothetical protein